MIESVLDTLGRYGDRRSLRYLYMMALSNGVNCCVCPRLYLGVIFETVNNLYVSVRLKMQYSAVCFVTKLYQLSQGCFIAYRLASDLAWEVLFSS